MSLSWPARITILVSVVLLVFVCLFPFLWMALSSIKTLRELYTVPPVWFPEVPTLANYMKVLFDSNIPRYFLNSTIISSCRARTPDSRRRGRSSPGRGPR